VRRVQRRTRKSDETPLHGAVALRDQQVMSYSRWEVSSIAPEDVSFLLVERQKILLQPANQEGVMDTTYRDQAGGTQTAMAHPQREPPNQIDPSSDRTSASGQNATNFASFIPDVM
jgi:hypothetical protein